MYGQTGKAGKKYGNYTPGKHTISKIVEDQGGRKRISQWTGHMLRITGHMSQVTSHMSQVTGHRSGGNDDTQAVVYRRKSKEDIGSTS